MESKIKKIRKNIKGITLVSLVVTIIVLLILSGVAISFTIGDNGIFKRAQNAVDLYSEAAVKEKLEIMYAGYLISEAVKEKDEDEIDIFLDIMGDKEITKEDIDEFNKILEQYGKKIIGITNVEELKSIGNNPEYPLNGLYLQLNDINFNEIENLSPIGSSENPFEGIYDGNGYKIGNLKLTNEKENIGIFSVNKGKIKNVKVESYNITVSYAQAGTIAGVNNGKIMNCTNDNGSISSNGENDGSRIGGIVGLNGEGGEVIECINNIKVSGEYKLVGGIVGYSLGGNIENCKNYGEIAGPSQVGGIAGNLEGLDENNIVILKDCINYGKITGNCKNNYKTSIGGIAGLNYQYAILENNVNEGEIQTDSSYTGGISGVNYYIVRNCSNKGNIQSIVDTDMSAISREIGGIAGRNRGIIKECYNIADIMGENANADFVGGIAGLMNINELYVGQEDAIIENSYNTGKISGNKYVGGISGRLETDGKINSCYNIRRYNWKHLCGRFNWRYINRS